ncbi:MAG: DUF2264 domain-containing protein [bacterium]|nr:DUF2264 domain-containing protein [bacterium]
MSVKNEVRTNWRERMLRIADPVIVNLAENRLKENMPSEFHPHRKEFMYLEAFGRTAGGLAPWLELEEVAEEEKEIRDRYRQMVQAGIANAVNPNGKDFMNFSEGYGQALVDAAFLAQGVVRAPRQMYGQLAGEDRRNFVRALKATRRFTPFVCNWILFSAMVETALYVMGEADYDMTRVEYAVRMFQNWYVGDGTYGDGEFFHWDYYNSFVIQPMLTDILGTFKEVRQDYEELYDIAKKRASRYAGIQEQMIGPDGTYPVIGRSASYRFGAFHALAQAVLLENLPENVTNGQVRSALTAVLEKGMAHTEMFDGAGWLLPGVYGNQPGLAEDYISVGSLYLCMEVFLPLGLPQTHPFWSEPEQDWTAKKIWSGKDMQADHAMD